MNVIVELTIFTQFDEVQYNKQCNMNKLEEEYQTYKYTHSIPTHLLSRKTRTVERSEISQMNISD